MGRAHFSRRILFGTRPKAGDRKEASGGRQREIKLNLVKPKEQAANN